MTTKKIVIQSFFHSCFSKIILSILFTWRIVKLHIYFLIGKKIGWLYNTKIIRELNSLSFLMIVTLRICDAALIEYYKRNLNSDVEYYKRNLNSDVPYLSFTN